MSPADLALLEIRPDLTPLERTLLVEIRLLLHVHKSDDDEAVTALEDVQSEAESAGRWLEKARYYLPDELPSEAFHALDEVAECLTRIGWR